YLGKVTLPDTLAEIKRSAFEGCSGLKSITIPKRVKTIAETAFDRCRDLKSIKVDKQNSKYSSKDGVLMNKKQTKLIRCPEGKEGYYIVPESVKKMGARAIRGCVRLRGIEIRNHVTDINKETYSYQVEGDPRGYYLTNLIFERGNKNVKAAKRSGAKYIKTIRIESLKVQSQALRIKWSDFSYAEGYEIWYSVNADMKKAKKIQVSAKKTSKKLKKLTPGRKYYVQVRPYLTDAGTGKKVYSAWSQKKSILFQ
ncbi:MAG: leucine-rich repeat protein, partial [Lachnospiraceae bacterium]|nr:leucine-rich repeat protein [Lachnospiraceae bacterium]